MKKLPQIDWSLTLPDYDVFQSEFIEAISLPADTVLHAIEFGIGNANTTELFLNSYPSSCVTIVDKDAKALDQAFNNFTTTIQRRIRPTHSFFKDFTTNKTFNVAFSALSFFYMHQEEQAALVKNIHSMLCSNGVFVLGNLIKLNDFEYQRSTNLLYELHRIQALPKTEAEKFYEHVYQNSYHFYTIRETMRLLAEAGFSHVDIAWCHRSLCVFRAIK